MVHERDKQVIFSIKIKHAKGLWEALAELSSVDGVSFYALVTDEGNFSWHRRQQRCVPATPEVEQAYERFEGFMREAEMADIDRLLDDIIASGEWR